MTGHSLEVWARDYARSFGKTQRDEARARLLEHGFGADRDETSKPRGESVKITTQEPRAQPFTVRIDDMTEIVLRKDKEWSAIDGDACLVKHFTPLATVEDGRVNAPSKTDPYALVTFECTQLQLPGEVTGCITQRMDFLHLWSAFNERGVGEDEEVLFCWTKKYLRRVGRLVSMMMPKLWVMVCPSGAFKLMTDPNFKPELTGLARHEAMKPLAEWKPEAME
jgi:hypothetical protein